MPEVPLRRVLFIVCTLFSLQFAPAARAELDVWLLTMGLGDSMWERYGHTALRVSDGVNDVVYSFGAAPFNQPSFIWSFLRGEADFGVVAERYSPTIARYGRWNRTVWEQKLQLSEERALWLARALAAHTRPPLNHYRYDHLYNNCATQVRDLIDQASLGALRRAGTAHTVTRTFRDDMLEGSAGHWFGHIGTDLIGGPYQDQRIPDGWVEMYLPMALRDRVADARLDDGTLLATPMRVLISRKGPEANLEPVGAARQALVTLAGVMFVLVLLARLRTAPEWLRLIAQIGLRALIVMFSVFGLVVVPLVLVSRVPNLTPNYNAFLFVPFDLVFFGLTRLLLEPGAARSRPLLRYLWLRVVVVLLVSVLSWTGVLQQQNQAFSAAACLYVLTLLAVSLRPRTVAPKVPTVSALQNDAGRA